MTRAALALRLSLSKASYGRLDGTFRLTINPVMLEKKEVAVFRRRGGSLR